MPFAAKRLQTAAAALRRGAGAEAAQRIRPAIAHDPRNIDATILAAMAARAAGRYEAAARLFRWALALRPGDRHAGAGLAALGSEAPPAADSAEALLARCRRDPENPADWIALSWSMLASGAAAAAWPALRRACCAPTTDRRWLW